jgi:hypothetical protein
LTDADYRRKILSSYLTQTYKTVNLLGNKSIIELGSGTGLVGLVAGKLDSTCKVYLTDQASVSPTCIVLIADGLTPFKKAVA